MASTILPNPNDPVLMVDRLVFHGLETKAAQQGGLTLAEKRMHAHMSERFERLNRNFGTKERS